MLFRSFSPWDGAAGLACLGLTLTDGLRLTLILALLPAVEQVGWGKGRPQDMTLVYFFLAVALSWLIRLDNGGAGTFIYFQF